MRPTLGMTAAARDLLPGMDFGTARLCPAPRTADNRQVDVESPGQEPVSALVYPSDPRDGWEPGAPSLRALAPSVIGGAIVPLAVYYAVRHQVHGDATALAIAGIPAAGWVAFTWVRSRKLDPIGAVVLFGFIAGLAVSTAMGGNAFVLKVRDSVFTALFGVVCLMSLRFLPRPMMFYIGRALSAGEDPVRIGAYDQLWDLPPARRTFAIITTVWGVGLICEAAARVTMAAILPTGPFLAASPALAAVAFGGMFAFTVRYSRWSRERVQEQQAAGEISG